MNNMIVIAFLALIAAVTSKPFYYPYGSDYATAYSSSIMAPGYPMTYAASELLAPAAVAPMGYSAFSGNPQFYTAPVTYSLPYPYSYSPEWLYRK